jgi:hypothetical protein
MFHHTLTFLTLIGLAASCSDNPCDPDIAQHLEERCQLQLGSVSGASCASVAPNEEELAELRQTICEIDTPNVDTGCLREETCERILQGACGKSSPRSSDGADCALPCQIAALSCDQACGMEASSFGQCSECAIDCQQTRMNCLEACD